MLSTKICFVFFYLYLSIYSTLLAQTLEIPIFYENVDEAEGSPECEFIPRSLPKPDASDSDKKVKREMRRFNSIQTIHC